MKVYVVGARTEYEYLGEETLFLKEEKARELQRTLEQKYAYEIEKLKWAVYFYEKEVIE